MSKTKDILFLLTREPLVSNGRIGRLKYLLLSLWSQCALAICLLGLIFPEPLQEYVINTLLVIGLLYTFAATLCLGIRRLHDMGLSGALVLLVVIIWPRLLLWPGQTQDNRYGHRPQPAFA